MSFTSRQIEQLLAGQAIVSQSPWVQNNAKATDRHLKRIINRVKRQQQLRDKTEYGHYGSGYASYVDCWLYRRDPAFRFDRGHYYWGLVVLFSRLSNYYVLGEAQKSWTRKLRSSYLPAFSMVDEIKQPAIAELVDPVCSMLNSYDLVRLTRADLAATLPSELNVPTLLSEPPWQQFDALFYWED